MTDHQKKILVESISGATLEGIPCSIAGYRNPWATIAPNCGGLWRADWTVVERTRGKLTASDVIFSSWAWLGIGTTDMPERLNNMARK